MKIIIVNNCMLCVEPETTAERMEILCTAQEYKDQGATVVSGDEIQEVEPC